MGRGAMTTKSLWNRENIQALLDRNDAAVARALILLSARQTADERANGQTFVDNGRGFQPCHAEIGVSMAQFYEAKGFLSPRQLAYWRHKNAKGVSRLAKYWRQLVEEIEAKKEATSCQ